MVSPLKALRTTVSVVAVGVAVGVVGLPFATSGALAGSGLTVVELYTSQGCSSCPPADEFLGELAKQPGILPLSFHVDYWDYIGWKDPFAKREFTKRQRAYSGTFRRGYVYTPQMIVHGIFDATGSDRRKVNSAIEKVRNAHRVDIALRRGPSGELIVTIGPGNPRDAVGVWMALYDAVHTTKVKRGENRGRIVKNYNVVRDFSQIGKWDGSATEISVPARRLERDGGKRDGGAVFLQGLDKGPILGAAAIALSAAK
jgi:hypothetical protein